MSVNVRKKGRGAAFNTPNRFDRLRRVPDELEVESESDSPVATRFFIDSSHTILARNYSPDIPFTYSLNPYRGC